MICNTNCSILAMLTGDVKSEKREQVLKSEPHILGVTPELIHFQLKQAWKSAHWANFYQRLRYILLDEAHTLSSSYGANMAWLIRCIKLAVDHFFALFLYVANCRATIGIS
ncbi:DEAD/DEAH box helicase [Nostoc sphaeroides]|uniref:DEAD/DEAH box helicase n=1 Tax=Nostoc sphaeroides TaxID=446679 RepID=UPI002B4000F9|nr:DEAD/DEAH box helicase [Nostoc sphaeroides]